MAETERREGILGVDQPLTAVVESLFDDLSVSEAILTGIQCGLRKAVSHQSKPCRTQYRTSPIKTFSIKWCTVFSKYDPSKHNKKEAQSSLNKKNRPPRHSTLCKNSAQYESHDEPNGLSGTEYTEGLVTFWARRKVIGEYANTGGSVCGASKTFHRHEDDESFVVWRKGCCDAPVCSLFNNGNMGVTIERLAMLRTMLNQRGT